MHFTYTKCLVANSNVEGGVKQYVALYQTTITPVQFQVFADDKINGTNKIKFVVERIENMVGKGKNAGHQHFLLFPPCFQRASPSGSLLVVIVW